MANAAQATNLAPATGNLNQQGNVGAPNQGNANQGNANQQIPTPNVNQTNEISQSNAPTTNPANPNVSALETVAGNVASKVTKQIANVVVKDTVKKAVREVNIIERFPTPSRRLQEISQPKMISYVDLYKNHRDILKPDTVLRIEDKISDIRKYSQVIPDDLKVVIVDPFNGINASRAAQLQMKIMESLDNYIHTTGPQIIPRFLETVYVCKNLKIVCADEFTVKWLKDLIGSLSKSPPWEKLDVTFQSAYPMLPKRPANKTQALKPLKPRVKFFIPKGQQDVDFDEVMRRIQIRNPPIETGNWIKINEEKTAKGIIYYVNMSKECVEHIKDKDDRLFYLLGTVKFTMLDQIEIRSMNVRRKIK